jgi:hypothetical protein
MSKENLLPSVPVMLPSSTPDYVCIGGVAKLSNGELYKVPFKPDRGVSLIGSISQHLYITSTRPAKDGEWILLNNNVIKKIEGISHEGVDRKIEATTDPELTKGWIQDNDPEKKSTHTDIVTMNGVPSIPDSFVEEWVRQKGQIKEIFIEMVETVNYQREPQGKYKVKVTSSASEVTIRFKDK